MASDASGLNGKLGEGAEAWPRVGGVAGHSDAAWPLVDASEGYPDASAWTKL